MSDNQQPALCIKPAIGASIEQKLAHAECVLNSTIYHLQELATAYERVGNQHAAYEARRTHKKLLTMKRVLHGDSGVTDH